MKSFVALLLASFSLVSIAFPVEDISLKPIDKSMEFMSEKAEVDNKVRKARQIFDNINVDIFNGLLNYFVAIVHSTSIAFILLWRLQWI